jgi:hypothetical protein
MVQVGSCLVFQTICIPKTRVKYGFLLMSTVLLPTNAQEYLKLFNYRVSSNRIIDQFRVVSVA